MINRQKILEYIILVGSSILVAAILYIFIPITIPNRNTHNSIDAMGTCEQLPHEEQNLCYEKNLLLMAHQYGAVAAMETIRTSKKMFPDLFFNCHHISHALGMLAFENVQDLEKTIQQVPDPALCLHGYLHGAIIAYFESTPITPTINLAKLAQKTCGGFNEIARKKNSEKICYHGFGHGFAVATDYDLPQALHHCDSLSTDKTTRDMCYSGVFMENATLARKDEMVDAGNMHHPTDSPFFKSNDPYYPCRQMSEKYAPMCALNTAHQYFYEHEYDIKILGKVNDMFTYCRTNIPLPYQHSCFYGIGEITSHHAGWNHKDAIIKNCMQGTGWEEQSECFKAAIQRLTWIDHNEAIDFCNQIPEEHKKTCDSLVRISKK